MEYYSVIKKEIVLFSMTWMNLEDIMLSEISPMQKGKYCMTFTYRWNLRAKFIEMAVEWW